jgi:hypothetical protein
MTTFVTIPNGDIDQDSPVTQPLLTALRDNLAAVAEDDTSAPIKIKRKASIVATPATTTTFTGLGDYSGVEFELTATTTGAINGSFPVQLQYSTNGGSTWSASTTVLTLAVSGGIGMLGTMAGSFDFATGALMGIGQTTTANGGNTSPVGTNTTVAGASLAIDAIRFTGTSEQNAVLIRPNGGTA